MNDIFAEKKQEIHPAQDTREKRVSTASRKKGQFTYQTQFKSTFISMNVTNLISAATCMHGKRFLFFASPLSIHEELFWMITYSMTKYSD